LIKNSIPLQIGISDSAGPSIIGDRPNGLINSIGYYPIQKKGNNPDNLSVQSSD